MQMSSGFEEKKLGEVVGLSDPGVYVKSTLAEEKRLSNTTGFGPSACSNPFEECTPALCEGHIEGFSGKCNACAASIGMYAITRCEWCRRAELSKFRRFQMPRRPLE
jgi:hypothetical protein